MSQAQPYILIAEDEPAQAELLRFNIEAAGFRTDVAPDGEEALLLAQENPPDLIVLDWMLPEVSGIEVCRRLRRIEDIKHIPIIMLTARGEESDKVRGFETGADDYVIKPYSPSELIARIKAILRRAQPGFDAEELTYDDLTLDLVGRKVSRAGRPISLGPTEFRILQVLMERPGRVLTRDQLIDLAWGPNIYIESRTVDVHIRRLRKALNAGGRPDLIRTVRGAGYALDREQS